MINNHKASIIYDLKARYPLRPPFNPSENYPEYIFKEKRCFFPKNRVYSMVREAFRSLDFDKNNYNTPKWNPLGEIIKSGQKVLIKPNFVRDFHPQKRDIFSVITHPSIIRAVVDYTYIALRGKGEIIIADAPLWDTNFNNLLEITGLNDIVKLYSKYKNFNIIVSDLRKVKYEYSNKSFLPTIKKLAGDPKGYSLIDLGSRSRFAELNPYKLLHGLDHNHHAMCKYHNKKVNKYLISKSLLSADVVISIPKLKVHQKAGVTLNLKNMLGICGDKTYLPHFRIGPPSQGGDEVSDKQLLNIQNLKRYLKRRIIEFVLDKRKSRDFSYVYSKNRVSLTDILNDKTVDQIDSGDWHGNDTIWRAISDINKIVEYADKKGRIRKIQQRKLFSIIDGIVAGESQGPLEPTPKRCGVILSGLDFNSVDLAAVKIMGFDYKKIPAYVFSNIKTAVNTMHANSKPQMAFKPPCNWKGHIEITNAEKLEKK